ncbi:MAG: hypothetical protein AAFN93_27145 [Bacteroidota bacterium]
MFEEKVAPKEESNQSSKIKSFLSRFINSAFIEKYEITTSLISKLFWPIVILFLAIFFSRELSIILFRFSRTTALRIGDSEIIMPRDLFSVEDSEAYAIIKQLSREELEVVMWMAGIGVDLTSETLSAEDIETYQSLHQHELVSFVNANDNSVDLSKADSLKQTEMGKRVYQELESILISIIESTSEPPQSQSQAH